MSNVVPILRLIERQVARYIVPIVTFVSKKSDPYLVLISCILSLRTKDKTTAQATKRLFRVARTPRQMVRIPLRKLEKIIYPVGFYRNKARHIIETSQAIIDDFSGKVPDRIEDLLTLKGVGRKTANLVLGLGFGIPAICVDTHVHRISNRLGWVRTATAEQTEHALQKLTPRKSWIELNTVLVTFGQNICLPVSPFCSRCSVRGNCKRVGVKKSR